MQAENWKKSNSLQTWQRLHYEAFILRHGASKANSEDLICCTLESDAKEAADLTPEGEDQVAKSITLAREQGWLDKKTIVISSPFRRAQQSAAVAVKILGCADHRVDLRLAERNFGKFNGMCASKSYKKVWKLDREDPAHSNNDVESVLAVLARTSEFFAEKDAGLRKKWAAGLHPSVLAITHGDPGQIAETAFIKRDPRFHRELEPLRPGELRKLRLSSIP